MDTGASFSVTSRLRNRKVDFILKKASPAKDGWLPEKEVRSSFIHSLIILLINNLFIPHVFIKHRHCARGWGYNDELDNCYFLAITL